MPRFTREFCHNTESVQRLSQVQYLSFQKKYIFLQLLLGAGFVLAALSGRLDGAAGVMCCLFGCWLLISWRQIPKFRAGKLVKECGGSFWRTAFCFEEKSLRVTNKGGNTALFYDKIVRLSEDGAYDYLFVSKEGAYMLPKEEGAAEEAFQSFLSQKTGLEWLPVKNAFLISFKQLRKERKNTR